MDTYRNIFEDTIHKRIENITNINPKNQQACLIAMIIGVLKLDLHFPTPHSLKSKRFVLKRITEKVRRKFNVSVSEIDCHDLWQRAVLGVCIVGREKRFLNSIIDKVINTIEGMPEVQILEQKMEFI